jgi:hypothetical protein
MHDNLTTETTPNEITTRWFVTALIGWTIAIYLMVSITFGWLAGFGFMAIVSVATFYWAAFKWGSFSPAVDGSIVNDESTACIYNAKGEKQP